MLSLSRLICVKNSVSSQGYLFEATLLKTLQVKEIREGLVLLKKKVSDLENKQKTVLVVALPEDSKYSGWVRPVLIHSLVQKVGS